MISPLVSIIRKILCNFFLTDLINFEIELLNSSLAYDEGDFAHFGYTLTNKTYYRATNFYQINITPRLAFFRASWRVLELNPDTWWTPVIKNMPVSVNNIPLPISCMNTTSPNVRKVQCLYQSNNEDNDGKAMLSILEDPDHRLVVGDTIYAEGFIFMR